ncbi:MAG: hypothetical protein JNL01_04115 [Bdellovibrionales bacterium]|nr:hypothetical protein [Bdellovibrionales bacterium]
MKSLLSLSFVLGSAVTLTGCTQSRVLQAQLDEMKAKQAELRTELYQVEGKLQEARTEITELQRLTTQMGNTVLAMRSAAKTTQAAPIRESAKDANQTSRTTVKPKHRSKKRYQRN